MAIEKKIVDLTLFKKHRFEISIQDGLLMRGCRIIIPKSHHAKVVNHIHVVILVPPNAELEQDVLCIGQRLTRKLRKKLSIDMLVIYRNQVIDMYH